MVIADYVKSFIGTAILGIVGWAYNSQMKLKKEVSDHDTAIAVLETKHEDLKTLIVTRFDASDGRLERIERTAEALVRTAAATLAARKES